MDAVEATVEREIRTPAQPRLQLYHASISLINSGENLSKVLRLRRHSRYTARHARVAESADAQDLKSWVSNGVRVQFPPRAPRVPGGFSCAHARCVGTREGCIDDPDPSTCSSGYSLSFCLFRSGAKQLLLSESSESVFTQFTKWA